MKLIYISVILIFGVIFNSSTISAEDQISIGDCKKNYKPRVFTPRDQLDFIKYGRLVLTNEDRSNPLDPKYSNTYHNVQFILDKNLYFRKNVFTGSGWNQITVEYQALYITIPLQGFLPWPAVIYSKEAAPDTKDTKKQVRACSDRSVPAGQYTPNGPDNVMEAEVWVMGIIISEESGGGNIPKYVKRQSPWFRINEVQLYKKKK